MNSRSLTLVGVGCATLLLGPATLADEVFVPTDYATIQQAIDAVPDDWTITVAPGIYPESLVLDGRRLVLRSQAGPEQTIIDGQYLFRGLFLNNDGGSYIDGFTVRSANSGDGAGMRLEYSSPVISNCIFIDNHVGTGGVRYGGGVANLTASDTLYINCAFIANTALGGSEFGGGIAISESSPVLVNCTFTGNAAAGGGAVWAVHSAFPVFVNCILWENGPEPIRVDDQAMVTIEYSDVQGGFEGIGNIDMDPLLLDPMGGNVRLLGGSPCVDAGSNAALPPDVQFDLYGDPRTADGDGNGTRIVDMGAAEYPASSIADFDLAVSPDPLIAGEMGEFVIRDAQPFAVAWLAYSVVGEGSTYLPPLNVTLDLDQPLQAGNRRPTDAAGEATWRLSIPRNARGRDVWFQAVQFGAVSNVVATWIN